MASVLHAKDFAAAQAVRQAKLDKLGFAPVCMAPGDATPGHSHTLVEEVLIVTSGSGQIQIEDETFDICAGSVAMVPAGKFHAMCNTGTENLEGTIIFNSDINRKKVVLKTREQHFAGVTAAAAPDVAALQKQNKKLKKKLKKLAGKKS